MYVQREFIKEEELITPEDISIITGMNEQAAERELAYIIQSLGTGSNDLLLDQYCSFKALNAQEVFECLNLPEKIEHDCIHFEDTVDIEHLLEIEACLASERKILKKYDNTIDN